MNNHDWAIFRMNYERVKERVNANNRSECMDISSSCYVRFGTHGLSIYKYKNCKWLSKTVNGWRSLSYEQIRPIIQSEKWEEE